MTDLLSYVSPIVCGSVMVFFFFFFFLVCIKLCHFSFAINLTRKRELVALLLLSSGCLVSVNVITGA